jgi:hypothetical protein
MTQPQRGCVCWRNPFRVDYRDLLIPGLKQPWALQTKPLCGTSACCIVHESCTSNLNSQTVVEVHEMGKWEMANEIWKIFMPSNDPTI